MLADVLRQRERAHPRVAAASEAAARPEPAGQASSTSTSSKATPGPSSARSTRSAQLRHDRRGAVERDDHADLGALMRAAPAVTVRRPARGEPLERERETGVDGRSRAASRAPPAPSSRRRPRCPCPTGAARGRRRGHRARARTRGRGSRPAPGSWSGGPLPTLTISPTAAGRTVAAARQASTTSLDVDVVASRVALRDQDRLAPEGGGHDGWDEAGRRSPGPYTANGRRTTTSMSGQLPSSRASSVAAPFTAPRKVTGASGSVSRQRPGPVPVLEAAADVNEPARLERPERFEQVRRPEDRVGDHRGPPRGDRARGRRRRRDGGRPRGRAAATARATASASRRSAS